MKDHSQAVGWGQGQYIFCHFIFLLLCHLFLVSPINPNQPKIRDPGSLCEAIQADSFSMPKAGKSRVDSGYNVANRTFRTGEHHLGLLSRSSL